jgi:putative ABC transport system ATP-binding protein
VARGRRRADGGDEVTALLSATSVGVRFHAGTAAEVRALEDAAVSVEKGAFFAVSGPSGCGKTTLLAVLSLMLRPTSGAVSFDGRDVGDASESERSRLRRRMGFAFQSAPMLRGLPLWENVTYGLVPRGDSAARRRELADSLLGHVGLSAKTSAVPEELSAGERQRAGLARALAGGPEVIFADEPTSNLDRASADVVMAILAEFRGKGGTVVVASHDPAALAPATDGVVLDAGRVTGARFAVPNGRS